MKTAEEWVRVYMMLPNDAPRLRGWIEQIQLDAMKEGMRRAANVIVKNNWSDDPKETVIQDILSNANRLTEKDL